MQYRPLGNTGLKLSALGFGGSSLGSVFGPIDEPDAIRAVHLAIDGGVNFLDTSPYYGVTKAETVLGKALRNLPRDRYYLASKVGQYADGVFDFSAARVTKSVDESLARLHVDHLDLIQCHDIEFADLNQILDETLPALHQLKKTGKVRHVGVTGLPLTVLNRAVQLDTHNQIETVLSFCRYELNDTALQDFLPAWSAKHIGIINAAPTGMGLLTDRPLPSWHPATPAMRASARAAVDLCKKNGWNIVELAIQFALANPNIATTLIGTASSQQMQDNLRYAQSTPDPEKQRVVINALAPIHNHNFTRGRPENQDPICS